jgi:hypothetical protein
MATTTIEPYPTKPTDPPPWDPHCPACLSGFGPVPDPNDPVVVIAQPTERA